jgi:tellurite resistance protein TerC
LNTHDIVRITLRQARRIVVLVVGVTVALIGVVMLVTPGPGILVIVLGLALLGLEFAWAKRWLTQIRSSVNHHLGRDPTCEPTKEEE